MGLMHILYVFFFMKIVCSQTTTVETSYGKVQGFTTNVESKMLTKFLGIPFAKPPVGLLRLQKPEKPDNWTDIKETVAYKPSCYEVTMMPGPNHIFPAIDKYNHSEDCLYLNVFIPGSIDSVKANSRAVMVWIYGGGWISGNANTYPGDTLAITEDVIVVTFNFRTGLFGFMASDDGVIPGNMGLFDQVAALRWVKENIDAFGGDVLRITIFGESAGADSVKNHLVSQLSMDLFSKAIIQSAPRRPNLISKEKLYSISKETVKDMCPTQHSSHDILNCLQLLSAERLNEVSNTFARSTIEFVIIDGEFLIDNPETLISKGEFDHSKQVIVGFMADDGDISLFYTRQWDKLIKMGLNMNEAKDMLPTMLMFYFIGLDIPNEAVMKNLLYQKYLSCKEDPFEIARAMLDMSTDASFAANAFEIAESMFRYGVEVYLYEFEHMLNSLKSDLNANIEISARHGQDIMYLFGYLEEFEKAGSEVTQKEKQLSLCVMKSFAEFARNGIPQYLTHSNEQVVWQPYTDLTRQYLKFTDDMAPRSMQNISEHHQSRISLWSSVINGIQNMNTCDVYFDDSYSPGINKGMSHHQIQIVDITVMIIGIIVFCLNW